MTILTRLFTDSKSARASSSTATSSYCRHTATAPRARSSALLSVRVARKRLARRSAIGLALLCELVVLNEQTRLPISSLRYGVVKFIARTDVHMLAACSLGTLTTLLLDVDGWDRQAQRSSSAAQGGLLSWWILGKEGWTF